jgi:hypothetical protein
MTKLQSKFYSIKRRCYNDTVNNYKHYGAKKIDICDEWLNDTNEFIKWAMDNGWEDGKDIHRIDNSKGYYPDNCQLLSHKDHMTTYHKKTYSDVPIKIRSIKFELDKDRRIRVLAATDGISFGEWVRRVVDEELRWYQED